MPGRLAMLHARWAPLGVAVACLALAPAASASLSTHDGASLANTSAALRANVDGTAGCETGPGPRCEVMALPGTSGAQAPEDDLADALSGRAATSAPAVAAHAVGRARAILAGDPVPGRAYSGMGLLNWNVFAKVRTVLAGGT